MYCSKCGTQMNDDEYFCSMCGSPKEADTKEDFAEAQPIDTKGNDCPDNKTTMNEKACPSCGNLVFFGEKFCIKCGKNLSEETEKTLLDNDQKNNIQSALNLFFQKNGILSFFVRSAWFFAFYFPIYEMISHINALYGLIEVLENFQVIMNYLYFIALIALFANKKYMLLLTALFLRAVNSVWTICVSSSPIVSIERLLFIVPLIVYLYIRFSKTNEFDRLKGKFRAIFRGTST